MGSRVILFTFGVFGCVEQSDSGEKVHTELDQFKWIASLRVKNVQNTEWD
jgi:hypothetical protein